MNWKTIALALLITCLSFATPSYTKWAANPITFSPESWECASPAISEPSVIIENGAFHMWYRACSGTSSRLGYWNSTDGVNFTNKISIINTSGGVAFPSVVKVGSKYYLYAMDFTATDHLRRWESTDRITWSASCGGANVTPAQYNGANPGVYYDGTNYHLLWEYGSPFYITYWNSTTGCSFTLQNSSVFPSESGNPWLYYQANRSTWIAYYGKSPGATWSIYWANGTSINSLVEQGEILPPTDAWEAGDTADPDIAIPTTPTGNRSFYLYYYGAQTNAGLAYDATNRTFYDAHFTTVPPPNASNCTLSAYDSYRAMNITLAGANRQYSFNVTAPIPTSTGVCFATNASGAFVGCSGFYKLTNQTTDVWMLNCSLAPTTQIRMYYNNNSASTPTANNLTLACKDSSGALSVTGSTTYTGSVSLSSNVTMRSYAKLAADNNNVWISMLGASKFLRFPWQSGPGTHQYFANGDTTTEYSPADTSYANYITEWTHNNATFTRNGTYISSLTSNPETKNWNFACTGCSATHYLSWLCVHDSMEKGLGATFSNWGPEVNSSTYSLATSISASTVNETARTNLTVNISSTSSVTSYYLKVIYNNTVVVENTTNASSTEVIITVPFTAPLVTAPTNKTLNVTVNYVAGSYTSGNATTLYNHTVLPYYNASSYALNESGGWVVEASRTYDVGFPTLPLYATAAPTYSSLYALAYCTDGWRRNDSLSLINNTACTYAITSTNNSRFTVGTTHRQETNYTDYLTRSTIYVNRTYYLIVSSPTEAASAKTFSLNNTLTHTEQFVWIVNKTQMQRYLNATNTSKFLNVSFRDEADPTGSFYVDDIVQVFYVILSDGTTKNFTITQGGVVTSAPAYYYPYPESFAMSSAEIYSRADYTTRSRFMVNANLNLSQTTNVTVWLLPSSSATSTLITVVNAGAPVSGAYVQIQKYDSSSGGYVNIDQKITNPSGQANAYLNVDAYYKFSVYDGGGNLKYSSSAPQQFIYANSVWAVTLDISQLAALTFISPYISASCTGNTATNTITFSYSDYTGLTHSVRYLAWRSTNNTLRAAPVCNYSFSGSSGGYACALSVPENLSRYAYYCEISYSASPEVPFYGLVLDSRTVAGMVDWTIVAAIAVIGLGACGLNPVAGLVILNIGLAALQYLGHVPFIQTFIVNILLGGALVVILLAPKGGGD